MAKALSKRQREILNFIIEHLKSYGYPPTFREIGRHFNITSTNGVNDHLRALEKKGYIRRKINLSRGIEVLSLNKWDEIPVVGVVAAGAPVLSEENVIDHIILDRTILRGKGDFALKIKGDSMIKAGIFEGDYCLVKMQSTAEKGDIVVALVNDEATVKRFHPANGLVYLMPENDEMAPIIVDPSRDRLQIVGVVIGLLRIYPKSF